MCGKMDQSQESLRMHVLASHYNLLPYTKIMDGQEIRSVRPFEQVSLSPLAQLEFLENFKLQPS